MKRSTFWWVLTAVCVVGFLAGGSTAMVFPLLYALAGIISIVFGGGSTGQGDWRNEPEWAAKLARIQELEGRNAEIDSAIATGERHKAKLIRGNEADYKEWLRKHG